jgi:S-adenosylmethionine decarboxylase
MNVGSEWIVDAEGCSPERLSDLRTLQNLCQQLIEDLQLHVVGKASWHQFPAPGGVTGLFLLTESHLACHTYPEIGVATFNLYCCNLRPEWNWQAQLTESLGATTVRVQFVNRGISAAQHQESGGRPA